MTRKRRKLKRKPKAKTKITKITRRDEGRRRRRRRVMKRRMTKRGTFSTQYAKLLNLFPFVEVKHGKEIQLRETKRRKHPKKATIRKRTKLSVVTFSTTAMKMLLFLLPSTETTLRRKLQRTLSQR